GLGGPGLRPGAQPVSRSPQGSRRAVQARGCGAAPGQHRQGNTAVSGSRQQASQRLGRAVGQAGSERTLNSKPASRAGGKGAGNPGDRRLTEKLKKLLEFSS